MAKSGLLVSLRLHLFYQPFSYLTITPPPLVKRSFEKAQSTPRLRFPAVQHNARRAVALLTSGRKALFGTFNHIVFGPHLP
jgi:hypothetical protein